MKAKEEEKKAVMEHSPLLPAPLCFHTIVIHLQVVSTALAIDVVLLLLQGGILLPDKEVKRNYKDEEAKKSGLYRISISEAREANSDEVSLY